MLPGEHALATGSLMVVGAGKRNVMYSPRRHSQGVLVDKMQRSAAQCAAPASTPQPTHLNFTLLLDLNERAA